MSAIQIHRDEIHFGASLTLRLERILRRQGGNEDTAEEPGLGFFTLHAWGEGGRGRPFLAGRRASVFVYVGRREAVRVCLTGRGWKPNAVKLGWGEVNAITGTRWWVPPSDGPRDYLVCPPEAGLSSGFVGPHDRGQFVAGQAEPGVGAGGSVKLRVAVFEPRPGIWPDVPDEDADYSDEGVVSALSRLPRRLGEAPDALPASVDSQCHAEVWDLESMLQLTIHLLHSEKRCELAGPLPASTLGRTGWPGRQPIACSAPPR